MPRDLAELSLVFDQTQSNSAFKAFFTVLLTEFHLLVPVESLKNRRVEGVYYPFDAHFLIRARGGARG